MHGQVFDLITRLLFLYLFFTLWWCFFPNVQWHNQTSNFIRSGVWRVISIRSNYCVIAIDSLPSQQPLFQNLTFLHHFFFFVGGKKFFWIVAAVCRCRLDCYDGPRIQQMQHMKQYVVNNKKRRMEQWTKKRIKRYTRSY